MNYFAEYHGKSCLDAMFAKVKAKLGDLDANTLRAAGGAKPAIRSAIESLQNVHACFLDEAEPEVEASVYSFRPKGRLLREIHGVARDTRSDKFYVNWGRYPETIPIEVDVVEEEESDGEDTPNLIDRGDIIWRDLKARKSQEEAVQALSKKFSGKGLQDLLK